MRNWLFGSGLIALVVNGTTLGTQGTIRFDPPAEWIIEESTSSMRLAQFTLPKIQGDAEDGKLVVYYFEGKGGSAQANLERWTNQMLQPDDRPSADVATTTSFEIGSLLVTVLDVPGIFSAEVRPGSGMRYHKPGFRLKAAVVETPAGPYFFKLIGPNQTVLHWDNSFTVFLESLRFE